MIKLLLFSMAFLFSTSLAAQRLESDSRYPSQARSDSPTGEMAKAFQLSITPDIAIHSETTVIKGIALNIWGDNKQRAIAIGLINGAKKDSEGLSLSLIANYNLSYKGLNFSAINYTEYDFKGWQGGYFAGLSAINYTGGRHEGVQTGFVNIATALKGLQLGIGNYTEDLQKGVQFGVVNYSEKVTKGLQVGIINIIGNNETYFDEWSNNIAPVMVLVNWRF